MDQPSKVSARRNFLLSATAGSVAAGAALIMRGAPPDGRPTAQRVAEGQGYRVTEHIRNYYRTTLV